MFSLADIWQPSVAFDTVHQPAWQLERTTARAKLGWSWRVHVWPEAPLLGPAQGHCALPEHKAPLRVTSATAFAKQSVKSRIMSGSTSESMSISLWCDLAKPYHVPKTNFWWIHITLMFIQWTGRTQDIFCTTGELLWEMNNPNFYENKLASHEITCSLYKDLKGIENGL